LSDIGLRASTHVPGAGSRSAFPARKIETEPWLRAVRNPVRHMANNGKTFFEEIRVLGNDLVDKVKALIHEGNVRRIIIKNEQGHTFMEIPVTVAAVGIVLAPVLAAVGALAAMAAHFTVVVEKNATPSAGTQV
jgi:hypothetical protein